MQALLEPFLIYDKKLEPSIQSIYQIYISSFSWAPSSNLLQQILYLGNMQDAYI